MEQKDRELEQAEEWPDHESKLQKAKDGKEEMRQLSDPGVATNSSLVAMRIEYRVEHACRVDVAWQWATNGAINAQKKQLSYQQSTYLM